MKRLLAVFVMLTMALTSIFAQADKIVGNYSALRNGVNSKIKIFKYWTKEK